jgi:hypothetical protein
VNAGHVVSVPDWLEKGVGETEVENALDGLLAEEVVDPVDRVLGKDRMGNAVQPSS